MIENSTLKSSNLNHRKSLSPSDYVFTYKKGGWVLFDEYIENIEKGDEIGSSEYVEESNFYFLKSKSLNLERPLLDMCYSGVENVRPQKFKPNNLKKDMILISKDSNVGDVAYIKEDKDDCMLSSGIHGLEVNINPFYIFAWLNSPLFKKQLLSKIPRGSTIHHAKDKYKECKIPEWKETKKQKKLAKMQKKQINLHKKIESLNNELFELFESHFLEMSDGTIEPSKTKFSDIKEENRLDTSLYTPDFQKRRKLITSYKEGYSDIYSKGFDVSRGQNLQESAIGKSIYSEKEKEGFYRLVLPTNITRYGTIGKEEWLGNKNELDQLEHLDIVIGAEGFKKGRSTVILSPEKAITNIHGIVLQSPEKNIDNIATIRCYLNYLRDVELIDIFAVGGNGGSLAVKYWDNIPFPNFTDNFKKKVKEKYLIHGDKKNIQVTDPIDDLGIKDLDTLNKLLTKRISRLRKEIIDETK